MPLNLIATIDDDGRRLDRVLRKALRDLPLSAIHRLLRKGAVLVDGKIAAAGYRVRSGKTITVTGAMNLKTASESLSHGASLRSLAVKSISDEKLTQNVRAAIPEILFEGAGLLILNKPAGIAVHGGKRSGEGDSGMGNAGGVTLEAQVRSYLRPKLPPSLSFRPGPLHRLDKMSSGVIAFSTSLEGARYFSAMLRRHEIKKIYLAIVEGAVEKEETWRDDLVRDRKAKKTLAGRPADTARAGTNEDLKPALTRIKPLLTRNAFTLIRAEIETGRTHQIRAQAAGHGHPLLGDRKYGGGPFPASHSSSFKGSFLLHAWRMEIPVETSGLSIPGLIEAPLPDYFKRKIDELFGKDVKF